MCFDFGARKVFIHVNALNVLSTFAQRQPHQKEAGGIILGKFIGNDIHVERLSTPTELDVATRYSFERHRLSAQIVINYEFYNSSGQVAYLGEWHTHPERDPTPSTVDRKMIKQQLTESDRSRDFLLLLIQGTQNLYAGIYETNQLRRGKPLITTQFL